MYGAQDSAQVTINVTPDDARARIKAIINRRPDLAQSLIGAQENAEGGGGPQSEGNDGVIDPPSGSGDDCTSQTCDEDRR